MHAARADYADLLPASCLLCDAPATTAIVPPFHTLINPDTGKPVYVSTMRLCEACRVEVVSKRVALGWSWRAERWGRAGTKSPEGDRYLRHKA
jgi:hypothetical protein